MWNKSIQNKIQKRQIKITLFLRRVIKRIFGNNIPGIIPDTIAPSPKAFADSTALDTVKSIVIELIIDNR